MRKIYMPFLFEKESEDVEKRRNHGRGNEQLPTKIIVECVYLGGQSMEDAFRKINEETIKGNIEEMMKKSV